VPIDLKLNTESGKRALLLSGPNGGGKTLTMKSFGLVAALCKLGLPVPVVTTASRRQGKTPDRSMLQVDFFDHVLVSIGDGQDVTNGASTFTAQLSKHAAIINTVKAERPSAMSFLVLLDELGSGTEVDAGGAIAQAILETLLEAESCRVVATTHCARLKSLAFDHDNLACAALLLKKSEKENQYQLPSFQLQYGLIGESYALGAASRSVPPLPDDVLSRAWRLMEKSEQQNGQGLYNQVLNRSLQKHLDLADDTLKVADMQARDMAKIQRAMLVLASAYDRRLAMLEQRVEHCYQILRQDPGKDSLQILGDTLAELRIVTKQVTTETERLRERGLRLIPDDLALVAGVSLVVAEGEFEGLAAEVVSFDRAKQDVTVRLSCGWDGTLQDSLMVFKRYQLASWDYDSVWSQNFKDVDSSGRSIIDSKRRLNGVLSAIRSSQPKRAITMSKQGATNASSNSFKSSRDRKASRTSDKRRRT
jgi:hypothetical protein